METLQLQQYDEWIANHLDELVTQYAGQVVAIHQGKIAIVGRSEVDVYREVRQVGLEPMPLVLRVPRVTTPTVDIGTLITHTPDVRGGRARIVGTGVTVQRIVGWYKLGLSPEEIAEEFGHLTLAQVHAALAYYHANREETESAIAADDAEADRLAQRHYPNRRGPGVTIRLYFDEDSMRRSLVRALRARGVDVITALDAGMIERGDAEHLGSEQAASVALRLGSGWVS